MAKEKTSLKINKKKSEEMAEAIEKEERAEGKIVEKAVDKIERGKDTVKEAEKKISEKISKETDRLEEKKENIQEKKKIEIKKDKKTEAVVNGRDLRVSTKQAVAICRFIKNKNVDRAIAGLEEVCKMRRAIPMKGEIPHRKGKMMSGRFPVKSALEFIRLLKSLKANAINHEVELEKVRLSCKANVASRPYKRFGQGRMKRSHVEIRLVPFKREKIKRKVTKMSYSNTKKNILNIADNNYPDKKQKDIELPNKSEEEDEE